ILDTSGSMESYLSRALGAIAYFCESAGDNEVHLVQCDVEGTKDDWLEPSELDRYQIRGFGYSDMSPAIDHFAEDPEITSVLMLTDGYIDIPSTEPPYKMLWVLLGEVNWDFRPDYGDIVYLPLDN
ncbi:MAG: VWA-like domain-containing protein, partial [Planctomycetaceae bacterium]